MVSKVSPAEGCKRMMQSAVVARGWARAALAGTFLFICVQEAIAVLAGAGRPSTGGVAPLPALRAFFEKSSQRLWFAPPASGVAGSLGSLAGVWAHAG